MTSTSLLRFSHSVRRRLSVVSLVLTLSLLAAEVAPAAAPFVPQLSPPSNEGELAIGTFRVVPGLTTKLLAAEPLFAQPVAFCLDEEGRIYVAEVHRFGKGVQDNRGQMHMLEDDLAAKTTSDRRAYFEKHYGEALARFTEASDIVRLLTDEDGDGVYETSHIYSDGYNDPLDGIGAGLLAYRGDLYYTCIPHLWKLSDRTGDGTAEAKISLHDGFGVRVAFMGHDMHGLILGPDGRLYFSIGDRGFHVEAGGKTLAYPDQGAVLRCELDGSKLEVVNTGLRNPQELAFDEYGNLFTGDNNSDGGDKARWVYLIHGSDSGWRMNYQYLSDRGPWNRMKLWQPKNSEQPAYIVPPIANFGDGPSGLVHYPGVGLPDRYNGHFFMADFRGSPSNSGVRSFAMKPDGASFQMDDAHEFIWSILATDVDFGFDGKIYVSDWVDGWGQNGKGRIYAFQSDGYEPTAETKAAVAKLKSGFKDTPSKEVARLLLHPDYRLRQRAQMELANRNERALLLGQATANLSAKFRLHGVWGLWQIARRENSAVAPLVTLLDDADPLVRGNVARVLGDSGYRAAIPLLADRLTDSDPHVQALAAVALGQLKPHGLNERIVQVIESAGPSDPTLRHALITALELPASGQSRFELAMHASPIVRQAAVVAARRAGGAAIGLLKEFLLDTSPLVVAEAVLAIHDLGDANLQASALSLIDRTDLPLETSRQLINLHFRAGGLDNARKVAAVAASEAAAEALRLDALDALLAWNTPPRLDRYLGDYRPIERPEADLRDSVAPALPSLFAAGPGIRERAAQLAAKLKLEEAGSYLASMVLAKDRSASERLAALKGLDAMDSRDVVTLADSLSRDEDATLRSVAFEIIGRHDPAKALAVLPRILQEGSTVEQQAAVLFAAKQTEGEGVAVLEKLFSELAGNQVPAGVQLELVEVAEQANNSNWQSAVAQFRGQFAADAISRYVEALAGGNVERGKQIFFGRTDLSCRRCHRINGDGGEVGPNLSMLGADRSRQYILEGIVDPNRAIAKGYETVVVQTDEGKVFSGIIKQETDVQLTLQASDGSLATIDKETIEDRATGKSGMPSDLIEKLSKRDLRDLIEYLANCRTPDEGAAHGH